MTAQRDVRTGSDTLAWLHNELAEIKSKLSLTMQAAEQSRSLAADANENSHQVRLRLDQLEALGPALAHLQEDLRAVHQQLARVQDELYNLRQSRDELDRGLFAESERSRQQYNELMHRFAAIEREIEPVHERYAGLEEHNRRHLDTQAQLAMRIEALESENGDFQTLQSRLFATVSRLDEDLQRLSAFIPPLQREDEVQKERASTIIEMLRRVEAEVEAMKAETNRINRIHDRMELVQAERTRHNERLNEITAELTRMDQRVNENSERTALLEVRMGGYQEELRTLKERLQLDREQISSYLRGLNELAADMRKRQIIALEKEIRDIRGRALNFVEE